MYRFLCFCFCFMLLTNALMAKEQARPKEDVTNLVQEVISRFTLDSGQSVVVQGTLKLTIKALLKDDSIEADITYSLSDDERQKIADLWGKEVLEKNFVIEKKSILAEMEKNTACPNFQIELGAFDVVLDHGKVQFEKKTVRLNFEKNTEELGTLFCRWARDVSAGRGHTYRTTRRINAILQGKEID
jgi:hypothetical protein